ncbi:MAG: hypothetical protein ACYTE8_07055 [Planctomycetota bacterium]|jgi:hypothetical protein
MRTLILSLVLIVSLSLASAAESDKPTNDEIAKELANPNTALTSLKFQFQYFSFDGDLPRADDQDMFKLFFQPTLPFPLENGKTVWLRPGVPLVIDQPVYDTGSRRLSSLDGLGDMTLDVQYGTILENGFLWSVGFSSLFPTASKDELGSGQWALGPGFQLGRVREQSVFGVFANHQWDVAGSGKSSPELPFLRQASSDEAGISLTSIQFFGVVLPGNGWSFGSTPIITYNHESEEWIVPLHFTVGKTVTINGRPWDFSVDLNYYVDGPDAIAPEWMVSFNVTPVVKNIFAEWFKD